MTWLCSEAIVDFSVMTGARIRSYIRSRLTAGFDCLLISDAGRGAPRRTRLQRRTLRAHRGRTVHQPAARTPGRIASAVMPVIIISRLPTNYATEPINMLNKVPKTHQPAMKTDLKEIWMAADRASATAAPTTFEKRYPAKDAKAVDCLSRDRDALLAFYAFPAEHWARAGANPIESVLGMVRHRTVRAKGALPQDTAKLMVFKLISAAKTWRRLNGETLLPKVIRGVTFRDGVEVTDATAQDAA
ncbi:hypothetical protein DEW08_03515 [Azospirillum thermophilum]|uniref:Mutator family transposase n=1 Tax=Azospirillum thermophilum TaxID=2202148 RepID=A0A2S2CLJ2_9PROT|nr:hypothetical protein DEW08_03515 [Azospirillum thermophilum]